MKIDAWTPPTSLSAPLTFVAVASIERRHGNRDPIHYKTKKATKPSTSPITTLSAPTDRRNSSGVE